GSRRAMADLQLQRDAARRHMARSRRRVLVHQLEGHLRGLAENALDEVRVLYAQQLQHDAVRSLALDRWLLRAGLVDAPADDLDRLIDDLLVNARQRHFAELERDRAVGAGGDGEIGIDLADEAADLLHPFGLAQREVDE